MSHASRFLLRAERFTFGDNHMILMIFNGMWSTSKVRFMGSLDI